MQPRRIGQHLLVAAAIGMACSVFSAVPSSVQAQQSRQMPSAATMAQYQQQLNVYLQARRAYEAKAEVYWTAIADKRRNRFAKRRDGKTILLSDYVLSQPPSYDGPKRPVNPMPDDHKTPPTPRKPLPVVADFLQAANEHYRFRPQIPASEADFKRAYARVAASRGLTHDQIVRVYAFETGGNGIHDLQSGLSSGRPGARAVSTAIGYNQLLTANSVNLMAEQGPHIITLLSQRAARMSGQQRQAMEHKIHTLKRMVAVARSVPAKWSEQQKLASTPQGWGIHAMVLDIDVGPLLQTHKLVTSLNFARRKGYDRRLSAAELEMMNLTGDGNGFDMVTMPQAMRDKVPTTNFFQRNGYERNPVAIRHNTVAKLLAVTDARMDSASQRPGARELSAVFPTHLSQN